VFNSPNEDNSGREPSSDARSKHRSKEIDGAETGPAVMRPIPEVGPIQAGGRGWGDQASTKGERASMEDGRGDGNRGDRAATKEIDGDGRLPLARAIVPDRGLAQGIEDGSGGQTTGGPGGHQGETVPGVTPNPSRSTGKKADDDAVRCHG
jgi:hypothetical protein